MSQNLSGNNYVLTHCLEPKGPAFSGETQCNKSELEFSSENSDRHYMKGCQCRMTHPAEITFWICETDMYLSRDNQITLS